MEATLALTLCGFAPCRTVFDLNVERGRDDGAEPEPHGAAQNPHPKADPPRARGVEIPRRRQLVGGARGDAAVGRRHVGAVAKLDDAIGGGRFHSEGASARRSRPARGCGSSPLRPRGRASLHGGRACRYWLLAHQILPIATFNNFNIISNWSCPIHFTLCLASCKMTIRPNNTFSASSIQSCNCTRPCGSCACAFIPIAPTNPFIAIASFTAFPCANLFKSSLIFSPPRNLSGWAAEWTLGESMTHPTTLPTTLPHPHLIPPSETTLQRK